MNTRFGADDDEPVISGELAEFEAELRRVLEQRLVQAAQSPRDPMGVEAAQLARMSAHMEQSDVARRSLPVRAVPGALAHVAPADVTPGYRGRDEGAPRGAPSGASATPRHERRHTLLLTWATLAAVALGVVLVRGVAGEAGSGATPTVEVATHAPDTGGAPAKDDVYLGAGTGADGAGIVFEGRVTWDMRGQDGVVRVAVFDRDGDLHQAVSEHLVMGSEWTPTGPLPKRFRVVVDRPADDGVSREELLCADYYAP